ncbi:MAG: hypothetical protein DWQ05_20855 [Calditrichaeota bacterium]|nr:MAG: hypothetical protein DWQ05_20855 [Calditrichota bacterium]
MQVPEITGNLSVVECTITHTIYQDIFKIRVLWSSANSLAAHFRISASSDSSTPLSFRRETKLQPYTLNFRTIYIFDCDLSSAVLNLIANFLMCYAFSFLLDQKRNKKIKADKKLAKIS